METLSEKEISSYILSGTVQDNPQENACSKISVVVCLYYMETLDQYIGYLKRIPSEIRIELYSSQKELLEKAESKLSLHGRKNCGFHWKENRGRDISTLLVAAKDIVWNSDYICFLHDKSANEDYLKPDTGKWIENLWENMVSGETYIYNIISLFEENKDLGILFPPEPIGDYLFHWYGDTWLANYENTKKLAEELGLSVNISREKMPVGMGTVFWAKSQALKRLFSREWKYEDFSQEPLPIDGTLNHAVERILAIVAEDAGFKSGTVMTVEYAEWLLNVSQDYARTMFLQLAKREHLFNMHQIKNLDRREAELKEYIAGHKKNYIYGAGNYGRALYEFLYDRKMELYGFVVTSLEGGEKKEKGLPVMEIGKLNPKDDIGIIIGVSYERRTEVEENLEELGFGDYIYGY